VITAWLVVFDFRDISTGDFEGDGFGFWADGR
jgi:hypothetical protein